MVEVNIPDELLERAREMYARAGYSSLSAFISDAVRHHIQDLSSFNAPGTEGRERLLRMARSIVPQSDEREHLHTGEPFTADTDLETRFIAMVLETLGRDSANRAHRWTKDEFLRPPEERDMRMEQWAKLMHEAGEIRREDLDRWDLPTQWIVDVPSTDNPFIPDPHNQAKEILSMIRQLGFNPDDEVEPDDLLPVIDHQEPTWDNFKTVIDDYWAP